MDAPTSARAGLDRLLERYADETADAAFLAGLAMIERGCAEAHASLDFRWRSAPRVELRRLRRQVKLGLALCRFAMLAREHEDERWLPSAQLLEDLRPRARRRGKFPSAAVVGENHLHRSTRKEPTQ